MAVNELTSWFLSWGKWSKNWSGYRRYAGAGLNFLQEKVSRFSELFSEFEFWGSFSSDVKVNPVFSRKGQKSFEQIFPPYSQHFTTLLVALHRMRDSVVTLHDTLHESTPQTTEKNTVKRKLKRESSRKSSENRRLFPGANLVVRPALPPPHNQIYSRIRYMLFLCWNSQSFNIHTGGDSSFTTQNIPWTGSFRTFILHGATLLNLSSRTPQPVELQLWG